MLLATTITLPETLSNMSITDVCCTIVLGVALLLSFVQIAPIKINPWSKIARAIGRGFNGDVMDRLEEYEANNNRYRILRFDDEIRHEVLHTKEHFDQILDDITDYENYCIDHPKYKNNKACLAIDNIRRTYDKCATEHTFL
jgi:hypothetical protein